MDDELLRIFRQLEYLEAANRRLAITGACRTEDVTMPDVELIEKRLKAVLARYAANRRT